MTEKVTTQFREALGVLDDGNRIYGKGDNSIVVMFDDLMRRWERETARLYETEDTLYKLALKMKECQGLYRKEKRDAALAKEELLTLKRDGRQAVKKLEIGRARIVQLEDEIKVKDEEIDNLQEAIEMCRDVIFDTDDIHLPPEKKKNLIRVCSRSQSLRTQKKRALNRVEETLESLENDSQYQTSFDDTGDLLDGPTQRKGRRSGNHQDLIEKNY